MNDSKKNGNTVIIIVFCLLFVCGVLGTIAFVMEMTKKKCGATPASEGYQIEKYADISSRSDCFRPGTCGFEKPYNNNTWCYTDKINKNWKVCSIDTDINPWKDCSEYIGKPNATNISDKCLNALWKDTGCDGTYIDNSASDTFRNWAKARTVLEIINDNHVWRSKGCGTKGIRNVEDVSADQIEKNLNTSIQAIANEIKSEAYESHTGEVSSGPTNTLKCIDNIIKIKNKADDKLKISLDKSKGISTSEKDFKNFYPYILEIVNNYKEGVERLTGEYLKAGNTYEQAKQKAKDHAKVGLKHAYNKFKSKKVLESVIGTSNISKFEEIIKQHTGIDVTKNTYVTKENYQARSGGDSYICTAVKNTQKSVSDEDYQIISEFGKWAVQQPKYTKGLGLYFGAMRHLMPVISHMERDNDLFWDDLTDFFHECVDGVKSQDYDRVIHLFTVKSIHLAEKYFGGISHLKGVVPDDEYKVLQNVYDDRKRYVEKYVLAN